MGLLIAYLSLELLATLWIAKDTETLYVFNVFGRNFHYVWFESGQRWTHGLTYGWRLAVLCSVVVLAGSLSYRIYALNPFGITPATQRIVFLVMLTASIAPIPWVYIAHRIRRQRLFRATARRLSEFAEEVTAESDLAQTLDRADYPTDQPWTAWHPAQGKGTSGDSSKWWVGLVPVVYIRNDSSRSALFTIDWETFLVWNISADCTRIHTNLPLRGPIDAPFRVESVHPLRGCPNWCLVHTELQLEVDDLSSPTSDR